MAVAIGQEPADQGAGRLSRQQGQGEKPRILGTCQRLTAATVTKPLPIPPSAISSRVTR